MDFGELIHSSPRLLIEVDLHPRQGQRFQPTWFPDLGAALFETPDGTCLLVESEQSMANRMELVCWDQVNNELIQPLQGLSYVHVRRDDRYLTSSIVEPHRLNSSYILESREERFIRVLRDEIRQFDNGLISQRAVANLVLRYDICSLLHGVFLARKELANGRLRIPRALAAFIEARGVRTVPSGGVKHDHIAPKGDSGFGHVPFQRDEYTAESVTAFFHVDLAQIRGYGLGARVDHLLLGLALFKILAFLHSGLRLRTACSFTARALRVTEPKGYELPELAGLIAAMPALIEACAGHFASKDGVTRVVFKP